MGSASKLDDAESRRYRRAGGAPDPVSGLMSRLPESQSMRVILPSWSAAPSATLLLGLSSSFGLFLT